MKKFGLLGLMLIIFLTACNKNIEKRIDLSGTWKFAVDPKDKGVSEKWFTQSLTDKVMLPGSMSTNGKGDDVSLNTQWTGQIVDSSFYKKPEYAKYREQGNIKIPFWLQSLKHYQGAAWYQKEVTIPGNWEGQNIGLFLERCHWESRLWVDSKEAGMRNSLGTPHIYDLTALLTPGIIHRLTGTVWWGNCSSKPVH
jgi:beta-galactosidase/beta-glucuronidase